MSDSLSTIARDSGLCDAIPPLVDKFIVDLANSIDVVGDHVCVQRDRSGMFSRMYDGFSGKGARRQAEINAGLRRATEGSLEWLKDLTSELARTNRSLARQGLAIARVNESVSQINRQLAGVATDVARELRRLSDDLRREVGSLDTRLRHVEAKGDAGAHLDNVVSRWEGARRYDRLSVLGRCYVALEELRWGFFGNYCTIYKEGSEDLLETAANRMMKCMAEDLSGVRSPNERVVTSAWLIPDDWEEGAEALAYLTEDYGERIPPVVAIVSGRVQQDKWSQDVPRISNASWLAKKMVGEVFGRDGEGQ